MTDRTLKWSLLASDTFAERARKVAEIAFGSFVNCQEMADRYALPVAEALEKYARLDAAATSCQSKPINTPDDDDDCLIVDLTLDETNTSDLATTSVAFTLDENHVNICFERDPEATIIGPGPFVMSDEFWVQIPRRVWDKGTAWIAARAA